MDMNIGVVHNEDLFIVMDMQRLHQVGIFYRDFAFQIVNFLLSLLMHGSLL